MSDLAEITEVERKTLIRARYDAECVAIIAQLIRDGVPPTRRNPESLEQYCERLNHKVKALSRHKSGRSAS